MKLELSNIEITLGRIWKLESADSDGDGQDNKTDNDDDNDGMF